MVACCPAFFSRYPLLSCSASGAAEAMRADADPVLHRRLLFKDAWVVCTENIGQAGRREILLVDEFEDVPKFKMSALLGSGVDAAIWAGDC